MASVKIFLFGDGTLDPVECIKELDRDARSSPTLHAFMRLTAAALRTELACSTSPARARYPKKVDSLVALANWYAASGAAEIAISLVLLCAAQLGVLIRECERDSALFDMTERSPIHCIGLCNGMIAASAAATCRSLADLLAVSPALVCLGMRLMFAVIERSTAIDPSRDTWTIVTPGLSSQDHEGFIEEFVRQKGSLAVPRRPYVSCESDAVTTISGPPSSLAEYFNSSETLRTTKKINTIINGAYHASHLWPLDFATILGCEPLWDSFQMKKNCTFPSINTGTPFEAASLKALLLLCMEDIASKRFCWGTALRTVCRDLKQAYNTAALVPVGPDRVTPAVAKALYDAGVAATIYPQSPEPLSTRLPNTDDIAIVGLGTRLPGADGLPKVWDILRDGIDTCGPVPPDRTAIGSSSHSGCFLDRPGWFDAKMFRMSPREARQTDPGQRLALLTTYEALEMAGYSPNARPSFASDRIATFLGSTLDDYRDTEAAQNVDIYYVSGGIRAFGPGRLNYHFKWEGPSMCVDTACSSSAVAVQLAFQSLRSGECDMAMAGGMNILTSSSMYDGLSKGGFLSKTGGCKTFGQDADGYCRGEGVGVVVLKRLQDAVADHDNIQAVIKSCATNHSAFAESITRPDQDAQVEVMQCALRQAVVEPEDVQSIEMHGTGTQAGDRTELSSAARVFRTAKGKRRHPLHVGSTKATFGHGEGAAGISSLIKVVLSLQNDAIPPNIGTKNGLNLNFAKEDLEILSINNTLQPFHRSGGRTRKILLNSFQAAGGNTAMVVEDAPNVAEGPADARSYHVVVVSGHTEKSFIENQKNLSLHVQDHPELRIWDLAYTTTARRMQHSSRKSYVAQDTTQLQELMRRDVTPRHKSERPVIFTFTGQGSHFLTNARQFMKTCQIFRDKLEQCERICQSQRLPGFMDLVEDPSKSESQIAAFQISLVAIQIALGAMWAAWGVLPQAVIGHSIGEYAALVVAGVLQEADALYLAGSRAQGIEKLKTGEYGMLSASIAAEEFEKLLLDMQLENSVLACDNGPSSSVVSGPASEVQRLSRELTGRKVVNKILDLQFGFHSPQLTDVGMSLRKLGRGGIRFHRPKIPVASTLLGKVVTTEGVFDADYLASQTMDRVRFREGLLALSEHLGRPTIDNAVWVEIGTHPSCGSMVVSTLQVPRDQITFSLRRNEDPWLSISTTLGRAYELGIDIDWAAYHHEHHASLFVVDLPRYSFDLANYWIPFVGKSQSSEETHVAAPAIDPSIAPFHYKIEESITKDEARVQYACDMSNAQLLAAMKGHLIEGKALCPASVYADLAYHVAARLLSKVDSSHQPPSLDLGRMEITSPLTVGECPAKQRLVIDATWSASNPQAVQIHFSSTVSGSAPKQHCQCTASVGPTEQWKEIWQENQYLIQSRIGLLNDPGLRSVHILYKRMIYTLFASSIVDYSEPYRIISRMAVDYETKEAVATLAIPQSVESVAGSPGPHCLDALMHMAGFVLNSDPQLSGNTVFIANGWSGLQLSEPLRPGQKYVCHTRMLADRRMPNVFVGNVTLLLEDEIIGVCRGLRFNRLARTSLQKLLQAKPAALSAEESSVQPSTRVWSMGDTSPSPSRSAPGDYWTAVLDILSAETKVSIDDLKDHVRLGDLGIDSLLTISLLDRFKTKFGTELPANTFALCETVGALREIIHPQLQESRSPSPKSQAIRPDKGAGQKPLLSNGSPPTRGRAASPVSNSATLCEIIATEVGLPLSEISGDRMMADLGIDSLLTLPIIEQYKRQTGDEVVPTFFYDHPTVDSVVSALDSIHSQAVEEPCSPLTSEGSHYNTTMTTNSSSHDASNYTCVSMRLQGPGASKGPTLFCLPDGSGSLFSYIHLPEIQPGLNLYALDSPFHKNPEEYNLDFETVATIYKNEIRSIQPRGPYMVAGWSLGGIHAYEVVRQLLAEGETVRHLFMLDSPCPGALPPLPNASLDLLEQAGVFQSFNKSVEKVAEHTRVHFVAVTNAFQHWNYRALTEQERTRLGKFTIIWAGHGVLEDDENATLPGVDQVDPDMLKAKEWLCGKRTKFGPEGWDRLVGKEIQCLVVPGNHFSMMFPPVVPEVAKALRKALAE